MKTVENKSIRPKIAGSKKNAAKKCEKRQAGQGPINGDTGGVKM